MKPPTEKQATVVIVDSLADLLGRSPKAIRLRAASAAKGFDSSISVPGHRFLVQYKSSASAGPLATAVDRLKRSAEADQEQSLPLIVVPYMGHVGQELCEKSRISWLDLSGNAQIVAPGETSRHEQASREVWVCGAGAFTVLKASRHSPSRVAARTKMLMT